jgi:hypothetical protein
MPCGRNNSFPPPPRRGLLAKGHRHCCSELLARLGCSDRRPPEHDRRMDADAPTRALFAWLINHQPAVLFSHNKPATSNQPTVLFSQNKSTPATGMTDRNAPLRAGGRTPPNGPTRTVDPALEDAGRTRIVAVVTCFCTTEQRAGFRRYRAGTSTKAKQRLAEAVRRLAVRVAASAAFDFSVADGVPMLGRSGGCIRSTRQIASFVLRV